MRNHLSCKDDNALKADHVYHGLAVLVGRSIHGGDGGDGGGERLGAPTAGWLRLMVATEEEAATEEV